jgi:hypothetical protein
LRAVAVHCFGEEVQERQDTMRTRTALAVATAAALALGAIDLTPAAAGPARISDKTVGVEQASDEVSARKRHRRVYRHRGHAAPLHAFGAIAGTIGGIIAANEARRAYRRYYYDPYYAAPYPGPYSPYPYGYADPYW